MTFVHKICIKSLARFYPTQLVNYTLKCNKIKLLFCPLEIELAQSN